MHTMLDIDSFESVATRPTRTKTARRTDPLRIDAIERRTINEIASEIGRNLNNRSLSAYEQLTTFHQSIQCLEACLKGDWNAMASSARAGIEAAGRVQIVSPYLICKQDEAKRNLASDQRGELQRIALRLSHAAEAKTDIDSERARCLRAAVYAAIAADRGLLHIVRENLGCVIRTLAHEECGARRKVEWTPELKDLARRYANAGVKVL